MIRQIYRHRESRLLFPILLLSLLAGRPAAAEEPVVWNKGIGLWGGSGNELLDGSGLLSGRFEQIRGFLSRESEWGDGSLRFGYDGSYTRFEKYRDLSYSYHHLMADMVNPIPSIKGRWSVGIDWSGRYDQAEYRFYDRRETLLYASARGYLRPSLLVQARYNLRFGQLPELSSLDSFDNELNVQLSRFFETRTTLKLSANLGYRSLPGMVDAYGSNYQGMGWRGGGYSSNLSSPGVGRFAGSLRVAQSLTDLTGAWLEYGYSTLGGPADRELLVDYGYYLANEILADEYVYNQQSVQVGLRHILSFGLDLKTSFSYILQDYPFTELYSTDGDPLGIDLHESVRSLSLTGSQSLSVLGLPSRWLVDFGVARRINRSNDPYNTYDQSYFYLGTRLNF